MAFDLREIWRNRELLYFLVWRDLKVRYKQTAFGALWALIQPLAMMLVFTLFFGSVAGHRPRRVSRTRSSRWRRWCPGRFFARA